MSGRAVGYSETAANFTHTVGYEYDNINNLTQLVESINGVEKTTSYTYDEDNRTTAITTDGTTVEYTYDGLGRVTQQVTKNGDTVILTEYFTFTEPSDTAASGQVATYRTVSANLDITYSYQYDRNGNITQVYDGTYYSSYVYDSANQLIRENNQRKNASYTWSYDNAGNILTFKTYAYTTSTLGDETDSVGYGYTDSQWGDLLKSLDGSSVDYAVEDSENDDINNIGNPTHIGELDLTWRHGRQLATLTKNGVTWSYTYNNAGLRTGRTNGSTTYKYVYNGSRLVQMTILTGADPETARKEVLDFTYDASGTPLTLKYAGSTYYYMVNLQGDVTGILDSSGNRILDYGYTAYGQAVARAGVIGNTANTLARINPLLYRGYVLDMGTGLYYLQSRYYDPAVGRFLNADAFAATGQGLTGNNMFAYCGNNPVNRADPTGFLFKQLLDAINSFGDKSLFAYYMIKTSPEEEELKKNPAAVNIPVDENGNLIEPLSVSYANESDVSVLARMLYGEDHRSATAQLWVVENRKNAGGYIGGNEYRSLILGSNQFQAMTGQRSANPASYFNDPGEREAWEYCVDVAYAYHYGGIKAIPIPFEGFDYTYTYTYCKYITEKFPDGCHIGGTWFY